MQFVVFAATVDRFAAGTGCLAAIDVRAQHPLVPSKLARLSLAQTVTLHQVVGAHTTKPRGAITACTAQSVVEMSARNGHPVAHVIGTRIAVIGARRILGFHVVRRAIEVERVRVVCTAIEVMPEDARLLARQAPTP